MSPLYLLPPLRKVPVNFLEAVMNIQLLVFAMLVALAAPGTGSGSFGLGGLLGGAINLVNTSLKALNLNGVANNANLPILSNNANNLSISNILIGAGNSVYATPVTTTSTTTTSTTTTTTTEDYFSTTDSTTSTPEDTTFDYTSSTLEDTTSTDDGNTTPRLSTFGPS